MAEPLLIPQPNEQMSSEKEDQNGFGSMQGNLTNNLTANLLGNPGDGDNTANGFKDGKSGGGNGSKSLLQNYASNNNSNNTLKNYSAENTGTGNTTDENTQDKEVDQDDNINASLKLPGNNDGNPDDNNNGNPIPAFNPHPDFDYGEDIDPDQPLTADQKQFYNWDQCVTEFTNKYKAFADKQNDQFEKWIRQQIKSGWHPGDTVPDLEEIITYPGKGEYYYKEVDAIYIVADSYSIARRYTYTNEYYGFWFYVNAKSGWTSVLQQRDAVTRYYVMNPIAFDEMQNLLDYVKANSIDVAYKDYTLGDLQKLHASDEQAFRKLVEKVQLKIFRTSTINGYGLYTPQTRAKLVPPKKESLKTVASDELPAKPLIEFKKAGIVCGYDGVNLRPTPYAPDDEAVKDIPALKSMVEELGFVNIPFNTHLFIQKKTSDGWYLVRTKEGDEGYVKGYLVETDMPDADAIYYRVKEGDTALQIVRTFYSAYSKQNIGQVQWTSQDFRNYVLKLAEYNKGGGITFPTDAPDDKSAWANVVVKKDMRIWIPSSATMYNMVKNTDSDDLFGQNWISSSLQTILDYSAGNQMIYRFLEVWRKIPQDEKEKNLTLYYQHAKAFLEKLRFETPGWLDALLLTVSPSIYMVKSMFVFIREFEIGYIDYLLSIPPEKLVKSFEQYIFNTTQLDYYVGLVEGVIDGVIGWFADIIQMIKDIVTFAWEMAKMQAYLITHGGEIGKKIADIIEYIKTGEGQQQLYDIFASFDIFSLMEGMEAMIGAFGQKTGWDSASKIISFMNQSPYEMGKDIGYLIGYLIPEILLAIFSTAIGNAIKWILKGVQVVLKIISKLFIKLLRITLQVLDEAIMGIKSIGQGLKGLMMLLSKAGKEIKFLSKLDEFFEGLGKFLKGKADDAIKKGEKDVGLDEVDNTTNKTDKTTTDKGDTDVNNGDQKNGNLEKNTFEDRLEKDPRGVYGYLPKENSSYFKFRDKFMDPVWVGKQRSIRIEYLKGSKKLEDAIRTMKAANKTPEEIARYVVEQRNLQKIEARKYMELDEIKVLEERNIRDYNDPVGPSPDDLFKKYGSWEKVIEKSMVKDPEINRLLGLE